MLFIKKNLPVSDSPRGLQYNAMGTPAVAAISPEHIFGGTRMRKGVRYANDLRRTLKKNTKQVKGAFAREQAKIDGREKSSINFCR